MMNMRSAAAMKQRLNRVLHVRSFLLLLLLLSSSSVPLIADDQWQAGVAKINITPLQPMWMSGYGGRDHPAEGKLTDLWAKALVIQDSAGSRAVLISLDLLGIDRELSREICGRLTESYQLERRQVAICTSHTHTGPAVGMNLAPLHYLLLDEGQQKLINDYAVRLADQVVSLVGKAIADLQPCNLSWGSGRSDFAVNRRNNPEKQVPALRLAHKLVGPLDHDVPVLAIRDPDGKLKSVVFGYACHATVLSFYQWSADYPGFAQSALEESHPGCIALFFAGCGADQNPLPRRSVELARHYGRRLATAVDSVLLTREMNPVSGSLSTSYVELDLPLGKLPSRADIEQDTTSQNKFVVSRAKYLLSQMEGGKSLSQTYPYPVGVWRIGTQVSFVVLGGEVVVDYALRLKSELSGTQTWVSGYANDVMAYIPSRRVLREGGYEGASSMIYYGLPTTWSPEIENMIVESVHSQVERN